MIRFPKIEPLSCLPSVTKNHLGNNFAADFERMYSMREESSSQAGSWTMRVVMNRAQRLL